MAIDPRTLVSNLVDLAHKGDKGHDLKVIPNDNGSINLLFGNNGIQKSYTIHPSIMRDTLSDKDKIAFDINNNIDKVYNNNYPSTKELKYTDADYEDLKNNLISKFTEGTSITQHPDINPDDLINERKKLGIDIPGVSNQLPGEPTRATKIPEKSKSVFGEYDPTFDISNSYSTMKTFETVGKIASNVITRGIPTLIESLYSTGKEALGSLTNMDDNRFIKDISRGLLDVGAALGNANNAVKSTLIDYFQNDGGGIDKFVENFQNNQALTSAALDNIDVLKYNQTEEKLAKETYNDFYLKALEDIKDKYTFEAQQAKGEATWSNWDWTEQQLASGLQSAGEFALPMVIGNGLAKIGTSALLRGFGKAVGPGLEQAAIRIAKNKSLEALKDTPKGIRDYVAAPIARASAALQDVALMSNKGEALGANAAMVLNTKFEADLEGYQAHNDVMDEEQRKVTEALVAQGLSDDQIKAQLEQHDWTEAQDKATKVGNQVKKANIAILGLSNFATWKLLGLGAKSIAARTFSSGEISPITKELLEPWYIKYGKGALELHKEGMEEVEQESIARYEKNKGYQKDGLIDSMVGATKYLLENYDNAEMQSNYLGGVMGSGVMQGAMHVHEKIFDDVNKKSINDVSRKAFSQDINKYINSVLDPIRDGNNKLNEESVRAHLIRAALILNNDVAKDAANLTGNWQMEHMLEQEGFNKLYYEARENGINHQDTTEYILGALKARPEEKMYLPEHKTPYTEYKGKASFMSEVEQGLARAQQVYDNLDKIVKHYSKKNIELTPEKRQRVFEALTNHKEFQAINAMLAGHISQEGVLDGKTLEQLSPSEKLLHDQVINANKDSITPKIDKDIQKEAIKDSKLNQVYQLGYIKVIDDLLEEKKLKEDSIQHKANKASETAVDTETPVEEVVSQMTTNPTEQKAIINKVDNDKNISANNTLSDKTRIFQHQMGLMFNTGINDLGQMPTEQSMNDLVEGYVNSIKPEIKALGLDPLKVNEVVQRELIRGAEIFRKNVGFLNMKKDSALLNKRYSEKNEQRNGLFTLERAQLSDKLKKSGFNNEGENIFNALNTSQILDAYQNADPGAADIIEQYYNNGNLAQGKVDISDNEVELMNAEIGNNETEENAKVEIDDSISENELTNDDIDSLFNCMLF